jgi:hypothetical protein
LLTCLQLPDLQLALPSSGRTKPSGMRSVRASGEERVRGGVTVVAWLGAVRWLVVLALPGVLL